MTALLFYFRVTAVFNNGRIVVVFFTLFWLLVAGCYVWDGIHAVPGFVAGMHSNHCQIASVHTSYSTIAVYDTAVFLAISWRLSSDTRVDQTWKARLVSFFSGQGLVAVSINVPLAIIADKLPSPLTSALTLLGITIPAILACRVFRQLKLKAMKAEAKNMPTLATVPFATNPIISFATYPPDSMTATLSTAPGTDERGMDSIPGDHVEGPPTQDDAYELATVQR
ncbi:hypothetical protein HWV62_5213 [Athelia sp. TMB]|nr:hypothetical protein HWV62_5213 [Athelia sp. TMB]